MGGHHGTILLVDESGELATRLHGCVPGYQIVKCARHGADVLSVITSLRFDAIVLHHPPPDVLEFTLLPALARLIEPPRVIVVADHARCTRIASRFGILCVREPATADAIVAAIDLVCARDTRVERPF